MYQPHETEARHEMAEEPGRVTHLPARQSENGRPDTGMRVVRVPGGFAYVGDRPSTGRNQG
jgi:hypothetical protein